MSTAVMLSIAGSDSSAGAGVQADLKTGFALGSYPLTVLSCVTAQVPGLVHAIEALPADFVAAQLRLCLQHFPVAAIKTGMLYSASIVQAIADVLDEHYPRPLPLVIDPVMIATAGQSLMQEQALNAYEERLIPRATLLTPNLDELCTLLQHPPITQQEQLEAAAQQLCQHYGCAILAKGGHLQGKTCVDVLVTPNGTSQSWAHPRVEKVNTHGTGCTLSAAIAALLAQGKELENAVEGGLHYVNEAIKNTYRWTSPVTMQALGKGR